MNANNKKTLIVYDLKLNAHACGPATCYICMYSTEVSPWAGFWIKCMRGEVRWYTMYMFFSAKSAL